MAARNSCATPVETRTTSRQHTPTAMGFIALNLFSSIVAGCWYVSDNDKRFLRRQAQKRYCYEDGGAGNLPASPLSGGLSSPQPGAGQRAGSPPRLAAPRLRAADLEQREKLRKFSQFPALHSHLVD